MLDMTEFVERRGNVRWANQGKLGKNSAEKIWQIGEFTGYRIAAKWVIR